MPLEAHFTNLTAAEKRANPGMKGKLAFALTVAGRRDWLLETVFVAGKPQARDVAVRHNATPWNF